MAGGRLGVRRHFHSTGFRRVIEQCPDIVSPLPPWPSSSTCLEPGTSPLSVWAIMSHREPTCFHKVWVAERRQVVPWLRGRSFWARCSRHGSLCDPTRDAPRDAGLAPSWTLPITDAVATGIFSSPGGSPTQAAAPTQAVYRHMPWCRQFKEMTLQEKKNIEKIITLKSN